MSNSELFQAMNMFKEGVKELSLSRVISGANEQVQKIRQSELSDQEKFNELNNLGKQFAMSALGMGMPASGVQTMMGSIMPSITSPEQRFAQASQMGDIEEAKKAAADIETESKAKMSGQRQLQAERIAAERQMNREKIGASLLEAQTKTTSQAKPQQADVEFQTNVEYVNRQAKELIQLVAKHGNTEYVNPDVASKLKQSQLDLAIAYAKIVDPASVAREGEVAAAQKYMVNMGPTTRNSRTISDIKNMVTKVNQRKQERIKANKSGLTDDQSSSPAPGNKDDITAFLE